MNHIYFATSNEHKFAEASSCMSELSPGVSLKRLEVDIPEIQSDDPEEILRKKVEYVKGVTNFPFIVDDAYFDSGRYPGFPGSYARYITSTLGLEGLKRLYDNGDSVRAIANVALHYMGTTQSFSGRVEGTLQLNGPAMPANKNLLGELMHIAPGITLASALRESGSSSHRGKAFSQLAQWVNAQNSHAESQKVDISQRWTDRSGGWKDLIDDAESYVNFEDNYARVNALIEKYAPSVNGNALEIGCGTGEAGRILKKANPSLAVLSTDISSGMLGEASRQTHQEGLEIEYKIADIISDDLDGRTFDFVLSRGVVISHLPRTDVFDWLQSVTDKTNPEGLFLFDFIQNVQVGELEKPVDSKNEFTLNQMDSVLDELGWDRVDNSGTDTMRVQVVCYKKRPR